MCFQHTTTIIRVNPSKNNSTESQNLLEILQIPPAINRISLPSQSTAPEESLASIFVASEQGLDTSVYKRVFKPPRLKSQICFILVCIPSSRQLKKYKIFVLPGWISGNIFMPPIVAFHEIPLVLRLQVLSVAGRLYSNLYIL